MNILEKVKVLGDAGKWDVCASSASSRKVQGTDRIGNVATSGICHSFTENGRCISLFKTLMTNVCIYDCKYCQNAGCKNKHVSYQPEELAKVFMHLYVRNYVEGLFLSSGISNNQDIIMEKMIACVELLRTKYKFQGYVHLKILPGSSKELVKQATEIADRVSINLEAPNASRISEISSMKEYKIDILRRQAWLKNLNLPSGHTTQLVVGGADETDLEILKMVDWEYTNLKLKRAYFSAFNPIPKTELEKKQRVPLEREHQLYAVDFMLRKYDFKLKEFKEILYKDNLPKGDPKMHLAKHYFTRPLDINEAEKQDLLHIPGIGPKSLERIRLLQKNKVKIKSLQQLQRCGVVVKRALPFVKLDNVYQSRLEGFFNA